MERTAAGGGASPRARSHFLMMTLVGVQLAASTWVTFTLQLGTAAFRRTMLLALAGFVVHALLPPRYRLPLFVALSITAIVLAVGPDAGAVVLSVGMVLIAISHLRVAWRGRIVVILFVALGLALLRARSSFVLPAGTWAVLAAAFMFRAVSYLQWLRHPTGAPDRWEALAYFFMLPTACFPLFPVVDYATFIKGRRSSVEAASYDTGVGWIIRGLIHLVVYRIVYREVTVGEVWANNLLDITQHLLSGFLLYLKVSGQFHVIVGLLSVFGFQLPETHHRYLLATSFSDFWRRINIYWKEFMLKLAYYPTFFRLRRHGAILAIALSTMVVFVATWALHSYQYFWLQGRPLISGTDAVFWGVFGLLVVLSALRERTRQGVMLPRTRWSLRRGARVVLTMSAILVLWSFWTSESTGSWIYMWRMARFATPAERTLLVGMLLLATLLAGFPWDRPLLQLSSRQSRRSFALAAGLAAGRLALLVAIPVVGYMGGRGWLPVALQRFAVAVSTDGPAKKDDFVRMVGYYNELLPRQPMDSPDAPAEATATAAAPAFDTLAGWVSRDDFLMGGIRPSRRAMFLGQSFTVNQHGFRGREYPVKKPLGTYRIAIIGPSYVMGWGVADNETLDAQLEPTLNDNDGGSGLRYELLNISLPAWSMSQEALAVKALAAPFSPDLVLLSAHPYELAFAAERVRDARRRSIPLPDVALDRLASEVGLTADITPVEARLRLRTIEERWHDRVLRWATELASSIDARVALLAVALPGSTSNASFRPILRAAASAGVPVLDCLGVFRGIRFDRVAVSAFDAHPNREGHARLAACVAGELRHHGLLPRATATRSTSDPVPPAPARP